MTETTPLTSLLYLPLLGAIALLAIPRERNRAHWAIGIGASLLAFIPCVGIVRDFRAHIAELQFVETSGLLETVGLNGVLGVDGISLWLVVLTAALTPVILIGSMKTISYRVRDFASLILLIEAATIGALCTSDLVVLFVFWQLMLIPTYLLIRIWGGEEGKAATTKFAMYTGTGSALLLIGVLYLCDQAGSSQYADIIKVNLPQEDESWLAVAFSVGFITQMSAFPLHGWLAGAVTQAPMAASVIVSGIILKMGAYGLIRFALPLFPEALAAYSPLLLALAVLGIFYGAVVAYGQSDLRKVIAYSSISQLSLILLGVVALNEQSIQGSIVLIVSHGLAVGVVFFLAGKLSEQHGHCQLDEKPLSTSPLFKTLFSLSILCLIGLPMTSGFVGQFLILSAGFGEGLPIYPGLGLTDWPVLSVAGAGLASIGFILAAVYGLKLISKLESAAPSSAAETNTPTLSKREIGAVAPLVALIFLIGLSPNHLLKRTEATVNKLVTSSRPAVQIKRDAKRISIRVEKRKRSARPGPGQLKKPTRPGAGPKAGKRIRLKGAR